ncbi:Dps family protein [Tunicatimonas pelagia]|uniref:Dps family protein n=1 Tax=Tunicatimonas pelagia TaxID=931531 RepID=UPI00266708A3|nr:DNA starvation/stationary phase protection protein [Tunicatimonas pelagia]WKN45978.1 DNA starvation/stationary phase protection protein [Tunicatimonas pelagia]
MDLVTPYKRLATPSDLEDGVGEQIAKAINPIIADALALYVKTKNYHWHLAGPHFRDYHLMFDEQAAEILAVVDPLAERVRKVGGTTLRSVGHIAQLQQVKDDDRDFVESRDMLLELMNENKEVAARMRAAHAVTSDVNDVATTSLLEEYIDQTEERTWFLFEAAQEA